ncbi:MAG: tetratricopeptide repeat protein [Candidatus Omnitrophica bacterium]|nr:tetratricopeptide repeat protein [Candidatus Omnitrophota bacterium]
MKRFIPIIIIVNLLLLLVLPYTARAYWVWTPETKKFINPKYAVKDTPKEQYDWAMDFYNAKDYKRAATEFEKLVKNYEYSEYAAEAQYYAGLSYDSQGKYYIAFQSYQKAIDNFPHVSNIDEIISREFNIGNIYASKKNPKVLGAEIMTSYDRAVEIYKKVVENAPFGKLADEAQFKMAATMKDAGRYDEATIAFQKILDDYPSSKLYEQARYEMANSAYKASLSPAYDAAPTDKALKAFEEFAGTTADEKLTKEAHTTIKRLKNKAAEKSFMTAEFYEKQKHYVSAIIYYQDVIDRYPDSISAEIAVTRIRDLKSGNYSHKPAAEFEAGKKGWTPWFGKSEKKVKKIAPQKTAPAAIAAPAVVTAPAAAVAPVESAPVTAAPVETAPAAVSPIAAPSEAATPPAVVAAPVGTAPVVAAPASVAEKPAEVVKPPAKKRWWAYGLNIDKKTESKTEKSDKNKTKKGWAPLNFDKKTEGTKKDE